MKLNLQFLLKNILKGMILLDYTILGLWASELTEPITDNIYYGWHRWQRVSHQLFPHRNE